MVWGGNEFKTVKDPSDPAGRKRISTGELATGALPSEEVIKLHADHLWHVQTPTHWCTFSSFCCLINGLAAHAESEMAKMGLDVSTQFWIVVIDCYAVHISKQFITWAKETHPGMILLYISPGCTAWLQPLDISFNGPFKRILRNECAMWLASEMQEQIKVVGDPTKVQLNVKMSYLKPRFVNWVANALKKMGMEKETIMRGWNESGMGAAMDLSHDGTEFNTESPEYAEACRLQAEGKLFVKLTNKTTAGSVERLMGDYMSEIFAPEAQGSQPVDLEDALPSELTGELTNLFSVAADDSLGNERDVTVALRPDPVDAALVLPEQAPMFTTLALQGSAVVKEWFTRNFG